MKSYSIYRLNFPNGKHYIGQTSKKVSERFIEHCWDRTGTNSELHRPIVFAMKKYKGRINYSILETNLSLEEANFLEKYYIKFYNSLVDNGCGYNLAIGGNAGSIMSESGKKRRSKKMEKHYNNPKFIQNITSHLKTPEHRNKMVQGFKNYLKENPDHYKNLHKNKKRPIICIETNQEFESIHEASRKLNIAWQNIWKVANGKRKSTCGLKFKYKKESK